MAITGAIVAGLTAASLYQQNQAQKSANAAAKEQRKANREQQAANYTQQMAERRRQIREERVRRAQIISSSAAAGTTESSGAMGAQSVLGTQLNANLGYNASMVDISNQISIFSQNAANFMNESDKASTRANQFSQAASFAGTAGPSAVSFFK